MEGLGLHPCVCMRAYVQVCVRVCVLGIQYAAESLDYTQSSQIPLRNHTVFPNSALTAFGISDEHKRCTRDFC